MFTLGNKGHAEIMGLHRYTKIGLLLPRDAL